jgi:hypothetical protein
MGFEQITTERWSWSNGHHRRRGQSRVYITKPQPYHQFTTGLPFPPCTPSAGISRPTAEPATPCSSLWVTSPPFSKPFFKCVGIKPIRDQTKGHPLG